MSSAMFVPSLRFPEFDGVWESKRLGDVTSVQRGRFSPRPRNDPRFYGGEIPFVQTSDVTKSNGRVNSYTQTLNEHGLKVSKLFPKGAILITIAANIGYSGLLEIDMACPDSLIGIICGKQINNEFLNHYLTTQQTRMDYLAPEAAQKNINIEFLAPYQVPTTTIEEQQKIADFLTAVDKRIEQLEEKKRLLTKYKKGVMQQIFSQQIRFKDDNGQPYPDWEEKRLGDVGSTYNGLTGKTGEDFGAGKSYITYKQIFDSSKINLSNCGLVQVSGREKQNLVVHGDLFFTTSSETPNEVGFTSVLLESVSATYLNSFCFGYRPHSPKELLPKFARYLFHSSSVRRAIVRLAQGSTRYNMSKIQLMKTSVLLPCGDEQQKIADFLASIDNKIEQIGAQLEQAKVFKKGLLQQMFV